MAEARSTHHDETPPLALAGIRVERLMNIVRWAASGLVFGIGPFIPNVGTEHVFALGAYLFVLSAVVAILSLRLGRGPRRTLVSHVALAGDAFAGMAGVVVFAPGPQWGATISVGIVLIGIGAFRGGVGGAVATLAATAVGYLGAVAVRTDAGTPPDPTTIALTLVAYAFAAVVFSGWHREVRRVITERAAIAARLMLIGRASTDVIYDWDIVTGAYRLSEAVAAQLGYEVARAELARTWWEERLHPEDAGPVRDLIASLLKAGGREWEMSYRFRKADGTYTTVHDRGYVQWSAGRTRKPIRMAGTLVNVDSVALYDRVTQLAGRALFADRVERTAVRATIEGSAFSVIVVDLARFRTLSASLGRERADDILAELARRFETHLGEGESLARIGHDQLAFLLQAPSAEDALARAGQIRDSARMAFGEDGSVRLDVVLGAAVLPQGGTQDLILQAQAALADAKRTRRRVAVYEPGGDKRWEERVSLRNELAQALTRKELVLHFQPIADARTRRCVAVEALVRWEHPQRGTLDAGELLQVVTDLDVGPELDRWVLGEAIRAVGHVRRVRPDVGVAVNLASASVQPDLPMSLRSLLAAALLPGDALTIELPEDPALGADELRPVFAQLRDLGVEIAIDDFGTGHASIASGPAFPATAVKLDRVFAGRVTRDEPAKRIVRLAVERARQLGLRVVGEGVSDVEVIPVLRDLGVELVQGRGIAKPMPLQALLQWLAPSGAAAEDPRMAAIATVSAPAPAPAAVPVSAPVTEPASVVFGGTFPSPKPAEALGWTVPDVGQTSVPAAAAADAPVVGEVAPAPAAPHAAATGTLVETRTPAPTAAPADPRAAVLAALRKAAEEELAELRRARGNEPPNGGDERLVLLGEHARGKAVRSVPG